MLLTRIMLLTRMLLTRMLLTRISYITYITYNFIYIYALISQYIYILYSTITAEWSVFLD